MNSKLQINAETAIMHPQNPDQLILRTEKMIQCVSMKQKKAIFTYKFPQPLACEYCDFIDDQHLILVNSLSVFKFNLQNQSLTKIVDRQFSQQKTQLMQFQLLDHHLLLQYVGADAQNNLFGSCEHYDLNSQTMDVYQSLMCCICTRQPDSQQFDINDLLSGLAPVQEPQTQIQPEKEPKQSKDYFLVQVHDFLAPFFTVKNLKTQNQKSSQVISQQKEVFVKMLQLTGKAAVALFAHSGAIFIFDLLNQKVYQQQTLKNLIIVQKGLQSEFVLLFGSGELQIATQSPNELSDSKKPSPQQLITEFQKIFANFSQNSATAADVVDFIIRNMELRGETKLLDQLLSKGFESPLDQQNILVLYCASIEKCSCQKENEMLTELLCKSGKGGLVRQMLGRFLVCDELAELFEAKKLWQAAGAVHFQLFQIMNTCSQPVAPINQQSVEKQPIITCVGVEKQNIREDIKAISCLIEANTDPNKVVETVLNRYPDQICQILQYGLQRGSAYKFQKFCNQIIQKFDLILDKIKITKMILEFQKMGFTKSATQMLLEIVFSVKEVRTVVFYQSWLVKINSGNLQVINKLREKYCFNYSKMFVGEWREEEIGDEMREKWERLRVIKGKIEAVVGGQ